MPRLLTIRTKDNKVYSCNKTCYDATDDDCSCICGGINHSVGEVEARINCVFAFPLIVQNILCKHPDVLMIERHPISARGKNGQARTPKGK